MPASASSPLSPLVWGGAIFHEWAGAQVGSGSVVKPRVPSLGPAYLGCRYQTKGEICHGFPLPTSTSPAVQSISDLLAVTESSFRLGALRLPCEAPQKGQARMEPECVGEEKFAAAEGWLWEWFQPT